MIRRIDPTGATTASRVVEIQRAAYAVEAELIGFDGIPTLTETEADVRGLGHMNWLGAFVSDRLVGVIAWEQHADFIDIDRLAIDPEAARQGWGRRLVQSVPANGTVIVSTGSANTPAVNLYISEGFEQTGTTEIAPGVFTTQFERR